MTSDYENIYSRFLLKITDPRLAGMDEYIAKDMMGGWMRSTVSRPYVRRLFSSINLDDGMEQIEFTMSNPLDDASDQDFVEELLSYGMVVQWLEPQVSSIVNTLQVFSNTDSKYYSQAMQLQTMKEMLSEYKIAMRKLIRDRGAIHNKYIDSDRG